LKYEHLYRHEIDDGHTLGQEVETYRQLFNQIRPHEGIGMRRPLDVHLEGCTTREILKSTEPETLRCRALAQPSAVTPDYAKSRYLRSALRMTDEGVS